MQQTHNAPLYIALSISTDYVIGVLFTHLADKISILAIVREDESFRKNTNLEYISNAVLRSLDKCLDRIIHKELPKAISSKSYTGSSKIASVHYMISSPWAVSQSKTIEINYDKPVRITDKSILDILDRERTYLEQELFDHSSKNNPETVCLEQKILDIRCNGYSTTAISNVLTESIRISFAMTISSAFMVDKIRQTTHKHLHPHKEEFHSALLGEFYALKDGKNSSSEAIFIRLLGESTDVLLVKHGISVHIAGFACGVSTLARKLSDTSNLPGSVSHESLLKYANTDMTRVINMWVELLVKTINDMGINTDLPQNFFISGESALLEQMIPALKDVYSSAIIERADYSHIESGIHFAGTDTNSDYADDRTLALVYSIGKLTN